MTDRLQPIILQKQYEVAALKKLVQQEPQHLIAKILRGEEKKSFTSFKHALRQPTLSVIAEIKRKSPSKGALATIEDPVALANTYVAGGANALSILTDEKFFGGHLADIQAVAQALTHRVPILRKDFIIDDMQIAEAVAAGADAVLGIVAVLGPKIKDVLTCARRLGIDVLVEIHNQAELDIALQSGADIIGINNRDLTTFLVDTNHALRLVEHIPANIIKIAESGITQPALAKQYHQAGFDAVLIGEALVTSPRPDLFIEACRG